MGHLICVSYDNLLPGEDDLRKDSLYNIIKFAESGQKLAPVPVRKIEDKYVHLDGQHSLIYHYLKDKLPDFYLAHDWYDYMRKKRFEYISDWKLEEINVYILDRWKEVITISEQINVKNYHEHFARLRKKYRFLKDYSTCRKYLKSMFKQ